MLSKSIRPSIPPDCPPPFAALINMCWAQIPHRRPHFSAVLDALTAMGPQMRPINRHSQQQSQQQQQQTHSPGPSQQPQQRQQQQQQQPAQAVHSPADREAFW